MLVNPDLTVNVAGGFIIQLLPGYTDADIDKLEDSVKDLESVTKMLSDGKTPEEILRLALKNFEVEVLYEQEIAYKCKCSRERTGEALMCVGTEDLEEMANDTKDTEVCCHFCDKRYIFTPEDIKKIIIKKVEKN